MTDLLFQKATPADIPSVLALVRSAYRGDASRAGWTTEADLVTDDRIDEDGLLQKINEPNGQILVARAASSSSSSSSVETTTTENTLQSPPPSPPLACCEILRHPEPAKIAYLGLFSVSPTLQNGGIGKKVLAEAERWAREEMGAEVMEMQVLWMRSELIAYYERRGYQVIQGETRPFPYAHMVNPRPGMREDLYFVVLRKALV